MLLLFLYYSGMLTLPALFGHQYLTLGLMAAGFSLCLRGCWTPSGASPDSGLLQTGKCGAAWRLTKQEYKVYSREFLRYSGPLFVTALCSALALSGERWMLQFFNGSAQQGYFSLSQKIGMACFMFVSAMTPLLMRDLAIAHQHKNYAEMAALLDRFAPMLYAVSTCLSCFALAEAQFMVRLFGGGQFAEALLPVQIMALYPIHQSYGQIAGAVFYATGETRLLRNLTIGTLVAGLLCAWILLAPPGSDAGALTAFSGSAAAGASSLENYFPVAWLPGGLGLGAAGLAWKMTGMQCITVNLLLVACRRSVPFRYLRNLAHQAICPAALLALAFAARYGTEAAGIEHDALRFCLSACCYGLLCLLLALAAPFVFGLERKDMLLHRIQARLHALRQFF
jgi:O-antigen/teichoic acid export membrane protein